MGPRMGGYGSGWRGPKRATVEDSLVLSVTALMRAGALVPGERTGGLWGWTYEGEDRPHAIVSYEANLTEPDDPWLRLRYDVSGERVDCMVRLVSTRLNYGGRRWWFVCPLVGRRAAKLYLPPGGKALREPRGLRADVRGLPGEREPAHRVHRRGRGRKRPTSSQGDAHTGLPRRAAAERRPRHGRAVVGAFCSVGPKARGDGEGLLVSERPLTKQMSAVFGPTAADEPA